MIKGFKNRRVERVFEGIKRGFKGLDYEEALEKLDALDKIDSLDQIPPFKSWSLHQLSGNRQGQWAVRVNGPWRIVFDWTDGGPDNVEITDYHRG